MQTWHERLKSASTPYFKLIIAPFCAHIITEVILMRIPHPVWRGFWLAVLMMASLVLMGFTDSLAPFRGERRMIAFAGAMAVGAFLGTLPRLLRGRASHVKWQFRPWYRYLLCFLGGAGLALSFGVAGDGRILPALLTGSPGACLFCGTALLGGFAAVRIGGRRIG